MLNIDATTDYDELYNMLCIKLQNRQHPWDVTNEYTDQLTTLRSQVQNLVLIILMPSEAKQWGPRVPEILRNVDPTMAAKALEQFLKEKENWPEYRNLKVLEPLGFEKEKRKIFNENIHQKSSGYYIVPSTMTIPTSNQLRMQKANLYL